MTYLQLYQRVRFFQSYLKFTGQEYVMNGFDAARFRQQFPALSGNDIYLDSAATALKPLAMIEASTACYRAAGTVHRSQHLQARKLTAAYEQTRQQVAELLNAQSAAQIIWTRVPPNPSIWSRTAGCHISYKPVTKSWSARWSITRT